MAEGGTKRLRGKSWQFRAYVGGRYVTKTVGPEGGRAVGEKRAEQMLRRWVTQQEAEHVPVPIGSMAELWRKWWAHASPNWKGPGTGDSWESYWRLHGEPALGHLPVEKVTAEVIDELYLALRQKLKPASILKLHEPLCLCFAQAVRWGHIGRSPMADVTRPQREKKAVRPPPAADVVKLIDLAEKTNEDFMTYLHLATDTGGRRSMLMGLRWDAVHLWQEKNRKTRRLEWHGDVVWQAAAVVKRGDVIGTHEDGRPKRARATIVIRETTKTDEEWRVSLHPSTAERLHEHLQRATARCELIGVDWHARMFVFTSDPTGALPWLPTTPTRTFSRLRARAGLPKVRLHDLRHFMATTYLGAGVDPITVMGRGGWTDVASMKRYAHFLPAKDREASKRVGDQVFGNKQRRA